MNNVNLRGKAYHCMHFSYFVKLNFYTLSKHLKCLCHKVFTKIKCLNDCRFLSGFCPDKCYITLRDLKVQRFL